MAVRRERLSWSERNELWQRWRAGESVVTIAGALERERTGVGDIVAAAGGIAPVPQRRSRLALTAAGSRPGCSGRPRRSAGRFAAMAAARPIARRRPTSARGRARAGRKCAGWRRARGSGAWWRRTWRASGRRSRSRPGCGRPFRAILSGRCRTKRSTAVCLSRVAAS